jgi:BolA protein
MDNSQRIERMQQLITEQLQPSELEIIDESHLHAGHVGAREGKGHFKVRIASEKFDGLKPLQRHRLIFDSLGDMMSTDIHALSIEIL